jgi:hypothetical protein
MQASGPGTPRLSSLLSFAILLGGLITIFAALHMVVASYSALPYWDGWMEAQVAAGGGNLLAPSWLWERDNEHRLVIPKLFLAADFNLFHARQKFLLASIFTIQLLHLVLLSWSMRALGGWRGSLWVAGTGLAAACLFYPSQYANLIVGFQVCFVLPQLLATLSFVTLLLYWGSTQERPAKPAPKFLVISILATLAASYSLASGNVLWPLLILATIYLRLGRKVVLSYIIAAIVCVAAYFYHYVHPGHHHTNAIASNLGSPAAMLKYGLEYFFGSLAHHGIVAIAGALVVLILAALFLAPTLSYIRSFRVFGVQLVLMILFWGGTGMITTAGRAHLGTGQAVTSRYQTVTLLFWCSVGLLLLGCTYFAEEHKPYRFLVVQLCLLAVFAGGALAAQAPIREARRHGFLQDAASASLITGVHDRDALQQSFPFLDILLWTSRYLEANQLSVFASTTPSELGKPLTDVFHESVGECTGALESVAPITEPTGPGLRLSGWAWDTKHKRPASSIVITTNGIIRGLGAVGQWRPDATGAPTSTGYVGFVGYVPQPAAGAMVNIYAILDGSPATACYLATR